MASDENSERYSENISNARKTRQYYPSNKHSYSSRGRGRVDPHVAKALYNFGVRDLRELLDRKHEESQDFAETSSSSRHRSKSTERPKTFHGQENRSKSTERKPKNSEHSFMQNTENIKVQLSATGQRNIEIDEEKILTIRHVPDHEFAYQDFARGRGRNNFDSRQGWKDQRGRGGEMRVRETREEMWDKDSELRGQGREKIGQNVEMRGRGAERWLRGGEIRVRGGERRGRRGDMRERGGLMRGRGGNFARGDGEMLVRDCPNENSNDYSNTGSDNTGNDTQIRGRGNNRGRRGRGRSQRGNKPRGQEYNVAPTIHSNTAENNSKSIPNSSVTYPEEEYCDGNDYTVQATAQRSDNLKSADVSSEDCALDQGNSNTDQKSIIASPREHQIPKREVRFILPKTDKEDEQVNKEANTQSEVKNEGSTMSKTALVENENLLPHSNENILNESEEKLENIEENANQATK